MHQPVKAKDKAKEKPAMTSFAKVAMMFRRFLDTLCGVSEDLLALGRRPSFYSLRARLNVFVHGGRSLAVKAD